MTEQTVYIDIRHGKIIDLDADEQGNFIAYTDKKKVVTNYENLLIDLELHFPIIRRLNNDYFLIADCRTQNILNGHILNFNGQLIKSFLVGDGVQDIIIHQDKIIATYFDEGVFGSVGPNKDGLAIFNFLGEQLFGVNSRKGHLVISDCYCICKHGTNRVLFYAYSDLNLSELNLDTLKIDTFETPRDFLGASALTSTTDKIIFHSSYNAKNSLFSWDRNKKEVIEFGQYSANLRGIKNGKFLAFGDNAYTIIDMSE